MLDLLRARNIDTRPGPEQNQPIAPQPDYFRRVSPRIAAVALLLIAPLVYFFPAVSGKLLLVLGDGWSHGLMVRILTGKMIAQGDLPLWNPYIFGGMPLLASIQPGSLYPLNWVFALFSPGAAVNLIVIGTYHIALAGAYLYARTIFLSRLSALVTALAFAFGGFMIAHLDQTNVIAVAGWAPWMLLAIERLHQHVSWWRIASGAAIVALQFLAGHPQTSWQIALLSGAYFLFCAIARRQHLKIRQRGRFVLAVLAMAASGAMLCGPQWLPTYELQQQGERAAITYDYFSMLSMPFHRLFTLVFPYFFGGGHQPLYKVGGWDHWWLSKWGYGYVGSVGLLLGLVAILSAPQRKLAWFWGLSCVLSLVLALGSHLPFGLNHLLYNIPFYNLFRGSYRHLLEFNLAAAVLAGIGMNCLQHAMAPFAKKIMANAILLLSIIVFTTLSSYHFLVGRISAETTPERTAASLGNAEALIPLAFYLLTVITTALYIRRRRRTRGAALIVVLFFDLASYGWFSHWRTMGYPSTDRLADPPVVQAIKNRETDLNSFRVMSHTSRAFETDLEALNHQNVSIVRGLQSINGYDPMRIERVAPLTGDMNISGIVTDAHAFDLANNGFNLLNVKYLIYEPRGSLAPLPDSRWRKIGSYSSIELYENTMRLPRVWMVGKLMTLPHNDVVRAIKEGVLPDGQMFNPSEVALFDAQDAEGRQPALPISKTTEAEVRVAHYEPQRIEIMTRNPQPSFIVLSEIYYPGWEASVDGNKIPITRVNYALRGLSVPSGEHRVDLVFSPRSFFRGVMLSALGAAILLTGIVTSCRKWNIFRGSS